MTIGAKACRGTNYTMPYNKYYLKEQVNATIKTVKINMMFTQ